MSEDSKLGRRTKSELEGYFAKLYTGWDRGVVVTQERFGNGDTRFAERPMTELELRARYVAAEIGLNIHEIANRAAFAPITTFSHIQAYIGPAWNDMVAELERVKEDRDRIARNRDMWKGQCERQAEQLTKLRAGSAVASQDSKVAP